MVLLAKDVRWGTNQGKPDEIQILKGVSLHANEGEFVSIVGASGSGKSSLLNCLSGLALPWSGQIEVLGVSPYLMKVNDLAVFRRREIGFIFQEYNLIPSLSAYENAVLPLLIDGKSVTRKKVYNLFKTLNFKADPNSVVTSLSGGEQQKVAIARVLLADSKVIFADEPTGAVDLNSKKIIMQLLNQLVKMGKTLVMVTHDLEIASFSDRAYVMRDGNIIDEIVKPNTDDLLKSMQTGASKILAS